MAECIRIEFNVPQDKSSLTKTVYLNPGLSHEGQEVKVECYDALNLIKHLVARREVAAD